MKKISSVERIFELLEQQNKTKQGLAEFLEISYNTVRAWSRFEYPPTKHLVKIAEYLKVSVKYLLCGIPEKLKEELNKEEKELVETFMQLDELRKNEILFYIKYISELKREGEI